jgi:hypothetical protein
MRKSRINHIRTFSIGPEMGNKCRIIVCSFHSFSRFGWSNVFCFSPYWCLFVCLFEYSVWFIIILRCSRLPNRAAQHNNRTTLQCALLREAKSAWFHRGIISVCCYLKDKKSSKMSKLFCTFYYSEALPDIEYWSIHLVELRRHLTNPINLSCLCY